MKKMTSFQIFIRSGKIQDWIIDRFQYSMPAAGFTMNSDACHRRIQASIKYVPTLTYTYAPRVRCKNKSRARVKIVRRSSSKNYGRDRTRQRS